MKSVSLLTSLTDVSFVSGELPIGTPTSPFIHHLLMKDFDDLAKRIAPFSLRYADDNFLAFYTKEDANTAKLPNGGLRIIGGMSLR